MSFVIKEKFKRGVYPLAHSIPQGLKKKVSLRFFFINPISPNSDQHQISPCNINAYSTSEVMRIKDMIIPGEFS